MAFEPSYFENFFDLAKLVSSMGEVELSNIIVIFTRAV
jgi:hypothetical protein